MTKNTNAVETPVAAPAKDITKVNLDGLNTSGKIRKLAAEGFTRGDIAKHLGKRYQHVRNVLVTPVATPKAPATTEA